MQNGHTFEIIRGTQTVDISDLVNYGLVEFDGFGMPPVRRLVQRGPMQNGDTDVGYRLDPRIMRLSVLAYAGSEQGIIDKRAALLGLMRPSDSALILRWSYGGVSKQIDVHYNGGMSLPSTDWRLGHHRAVFELRASDPTWYLTDASTTVFARDGSGSGMVFPFVLPVNFGASVISSTQLIQLPDANAWVTFPVITIYGRIDSPKIENLTTGDVIDFSGNNIGVSEYVTIDLAYGTKTIVHTSSGGVATNWVSKITTSSDLATWSLQPGDNSVRLIGTNADGTTRVEITYNERLIGV